MPGETVQRRLNDQPASVEVQAGQRLASSGICVQHSGQALVLGGGASLGMSVSAALL